MWQQVQERAKNVNVSGAVTEQAHLTCVSVVAVQVVVQQAGTKEKAGKARKTQIDRYDGGKERE